MTEIELETEGCFVTCFDSDNGANLLEIPPRSERFTSFHNETRSLGELDNFIAKRLLKGAKDKGSKGTVYVYGLKDDKRFVKIGRTSRCREDRRKEISPQNRCGVLRSDPHEGQRPFRNWILAEDIVKEELYNLRRRKIPRSEDTGAKVATKPESGYTEWYEIGEREANNVVDKWRNWLDMCEPYDQEGGLTPFWRNVIENRERYDVEKHGDMHARWSSILKQPTRRQVRWFWVKQILRPTRDYGVALFGAMMNLEKRSRPLTIWAALAWLSRVAYGPFGVALVVIWMLLALVGPIPT
jgi:hypothetical protein